MKYGVFTLFVNVDLKWALKSKLKKKTKQIVVGSLLKDPVSKADQTEEKETKIKHQEGGKKGKNPRKQLKLIQCLHTNNWSHEI